MASSISAMSASCSCKFDASISSARFCSIEFSPSDSSSTSSSELELLVSPLNSSTSFSVSDVSSGSSSIVSSLSEALFISSSMFGCVTATAFDTSRSSCHMTVMFDTSRSSRSCTSISDLHVFAVLSKLRRMLSIAPRVRR